MELTLDNVYQMLESTEYTVEKITGYDHTTKQNLFKLQDWTDTIKFMLDSFWPGNRIKYLEKDDTIYTGGYCHLNEKYEKKLFSNVHRLMITSFYSKIITKLNNLEKEKKTLDPYNEEIWEGDFFTQKLRWNSEKFPILFDFLVENKDKIKEKSLSTDETGRVYYLLKGLLNYTYGAMNNPCSFIRCNNFSAVATTGRNIMSYFNETYPNHVIYTDTDEIYFSAFDEIRNDVENKFKEIDFSYEIEEWKYFIPFAKKHHISSNSELKCRGIKEIPNLRIHNEQIQNIIEKNREKIVAKRFAQPLPFGYYNEKNEWVADETPMEGNIDENWEENWKNCKKQSSFYKNYKKQSSFYCDEGLTNEETKRII
jgi:hypothetical protein